VADSLITTLAGELIETVSAAFATAPWPIAAERCAIALASRPIDATPLSAVARAFAPTAVAPAPTASEPLPIATPKLPLARAPLFPMVGNVVHYQGFKDSLTCREARSCNCSHVREVAGMWSKSAGCDHFQREWIDLKFSRKISPKQV
jgi:hypothetical protein